MVKMKTKTMLVVLIMGVLLVGSASAYICMNPNNDNQEVLKFKNNLNLQALQNDIDTHNLTRESFELKIKYFNPCN